MNNKKNIYLVQAGCLYGDTYYLPYAVGMLAAYAFEDEYIKEEYELKRIIYSLEDIDDSIDSLDNPFFVGFSNSIWNYQYNLEYAKKNLKRIPLDVQKEKYEEIKAAADRVGETVNGYIKKAIDERMQRENR